MPERPGLSMVLKQTSLSVSVCLRPLFVQICDPSLRDHTTVANSPHNPSPLCLSVSLSVSRSHKHSHSHTHRFSSEEEQHQCRVTVCFCLCSSVSTEVRVTWTQQEQLIHVTPSRQGKFKVLCRFLPNCCR